MKQILRVFLLLVLCISLTGCVRWWRFLPGNNVANESQPTESQEQEEVISYNTNPINFTIEEIKGEVGSTVMLPVYILDCAPVVNADMTVVYDPEIIQPIGKVDVSSGLTNYTEIADWDGVVKSDIPKKGNLSIMLATGSNGCKNCILFYIPFKILSGKETSTTVSLSVSVCHISDDTGNIDLNAMDLNLVSTTDGDIKISPAKPTKSTNESTTTTKS